MQHLQFGNTCVCLVWADLDAVTLLKDYIRIKTVHPNPGKLLRLRLNDTNVFQITLMLWNLFEISLGSQASNLTGIVYCCLHHKSLHALQIRVCKEQACLRDDSARVTLVQVGA